MANPRIIWILLLVLIILVSFMITWYSAMIVDLVDERWTLSSGDQQIDLSSDRQNLPRLIVWTNLFGRKYPIEEVATNGLMQCGSDVQCYLTNDERYFKNSSAVLFHGRASNLSRRITEAKSFPRPTKQIWVYFSSESPAHSPKVPDNVFNWSMTYKLDSDVYSPYGMVCNGTENDGFDPTKNYLTGRTKLAFVVVSNCVGHRMKLYNKLMKHFDLEILGKCGKPCGRDCFSNVTQYKFYFAFENSLCTDYLTEKTYFQLRRGIVPVVLSGANLSNPLVVPPGSVIDANKFSTAAELAEYLKKVGNDPLLYNKFYEWRNHWKITGCHTLIGFCRVCEKLLKDSVISKSLPNDMSWFSKDNDCKPYKEWD